VLNERRNAPEAHGGVRRRPRFPAGLIIRPEQGRSGAELARLGYADAILWVLDTNDRARRFYALAGWADDGARKTDGSRGFDITEVRYRRTLRRCA
jgi:hypothetical protein